MRLLNKAYFLKCISQLPIILLFALQALSCHFAHAQKRDELCANLPLISLFKQWVIAEETQYVLNKTVGCIRPFSHYLTTVYFLLQLASYHEKRGDQAHHVHTTEHLDTLMKYSGKEVSKGIIDFTIALKSAQHYLDEHVPEYLLFIQSTRENALTGEGSNGLLMSDNQTDHAAAPPTWPTNKPLQPQLPVLVKDTSPWQPMISIVAAVSGFFGLYYMMDRYVYGDADTRIKNAQQKVDHLSAWQVSKKAELARYKNSKIKNTIASLKKQQAVITSIDALCKLVERTKKSNLATFELKIGAYKNKITEEEKDYKAKAHKIIEAALNDRQPYAHWIGKGDQCIKQDANIAAKEADDALKAITNKDILSPGGENKADIMTTVVNAMARFTRKLEILENAKIEGS